MTSSPEVYRQQAAEYAVGLVESGMVLGLGSGRTARYALHAIAERLKRGSLRQIIGVPTSEKVAAEAAELGIPLTSLDVHSRIDLTIDGADEINPALDVIKGGGGALLREKIVAQASTREVIVAEESKLATALGVSWAVPVEVIPFGWKVAAEHISSLGGVPVLRTSDDGSLYRTDEGNYILDSQFGVIGDPPALAARLVTIAAVVEHGLFIRLVHDVIVAGENGVRHLKR